ncbi:MAG: hypothetical protein Kow0069_16920 [Promethearchaeota archaeon]
MLSWKQRWVLVFLVLGVALGGAVGNQVAIEVEGVGADLNVKEAYFFRSNHWARYAYDDGTGGPGAAPKSLELRGTVLDASTTNVTVTVDGALQGSFLVTPAGRVLQGGKDDGNYSIWWVYVPNVFMMLGLMGGEVYDAVDPTGFLGVADQSFRMVVTDKRVFWPSDPEQRALSGAQSAFELTIYGEQTNATVATVVADITCGVVEVFRGARGGRQYELRLVDTSFPISRNRNLVLTFDVLIGAVLGVLLYLVTSGRLSKGPLAKLQLPPEERKEAVVVYSTGAAAVVVEVLDIWFYMFFGKEGMLYLHLAFFTWIVVACKLLGYGYKWSAPAFLEVAFVFALGAITNDPYAPAITANIGSLVSWLALVWASGSEKVEADREQRGALAGFLSSLF